MAETQKTIQKEVVVSGVGLFTGEKVSLRILPSPVHSGIVFQRVDLPHSASIPAKLCYVQQAPRCTRLVKDQVGINMVEHLLSSLDAMGVTNVWK